MQFVSRDLVFCIGPAGTGKTYLAVVLAVQAMKTGSAKRIILTRPAVEAGESSRLPSRRLKRESRPILTSAIRRAYTMFWERNRRSDLWNGESLKLHHLLI